jgi:hypothetical protein
MQVSPSAVRAMIGLKGSCHAPIEIKSLAVGYDVPVLEFKCKSY